MQGEEYFGNSLGAHGPENFYIEILWIAFSCEDAFANEEDFIQEHQTKRSQGGYNIHDGGEGFTSEDARRELVM